MTMTDPIADMLTRLRNANQAFHDSTSMPHSKIKVKIAEILKEQGYIASYEVLEPGEGEVSKTLKITLKYSADRQRALAGLRRISKPGLRVYAKRNDLPKVLGGMGIAIISTSQGLMTDKQANSKSVGGVIPAASTIVAAATITAASRAGTGTGRRVFVRHVYSFPL